MSTPNISTLPKWAQAHINHLQMERNTAVRELRAWSDSQTESPVSITEYVCLGEQSGPSYMERYVQTRRLKINWHGIELRVALSEQDSQHENGIDLSWSPVVAGNQMVALIPTSYQSAALITKENMR